MAIYKDKMGRGMSLPDMKIGRANTQERLSAVSKRKRMQWSGNENFYLKKPGVLI